VGATPTVSGYTQTNPVLGSGSTINRQRHELRQRLRGPRGSASASVSYVSSTQLSVTLPAVTPADGIYSLEVINPNG